MRGRAEVVGEDRVLAVLALARMAAVSAVEPARVLQPPVPAARRLEQVAADASSWRGAAATPPAGRPPAAPPGSSRPPPARRASCRRRSGRRRPPAGRRRGCRRASPRGGSGPAAAARPPCRRGWRARRRASSTLLALTSCNALLLLRPGPRLRERAQHLLARDRDLVHVGAGRVADRVRDRRGGRDDRRLAEPLRAEARQMLVRDRRRTR